MWCDEIRCGDSLINLLNCDVTWYSVMKLDVETPWSTCWIVMWRDVVWCGVMRCGVMRYDAVQCDEVWCDVMWCSVVKCGARSCSAVYYSVLLCFNLTPHSSMPSLTAHVFQPLKVLLDTYNIFAGGSRTHHQECWERISAGGRENSRADRTLPASSWRIPRSTNCW